MKNIIFVLFISCLTLGGCDCSDVPENNNQNTGTDSGDSNGSGDSGNADGNGGNGDADNVDPFGDDDGDGVPNQFDNCLTDSNPQQEDTDNDSVGDACDNCPEQPNFFQGDDDNDGQGDVCEDEPAGEICAMQETEFVQLNPNIYIVVDRSTSMRANDGVGSTRMERARAGLDLIGTQLASDVRLGLSTYPCGNSNDACETLNKELIGIGDHNTATFQASYTTNYTDDTCPHGADGNLPAGLDIEEGGRHCTETGAALADLLTRNALSDATDPQDAARERAVVLITDGGACGCAAQAEAVAEAANLNAAGIPVYVVGFNTGTNLTNLLDEVAVAGGTDAGAAGSPFFYEAADAQDLSNVLGNINSLTIPCSFELTTPPEDPNRIWVSVVGSFIDEDPANGFSYDAATNTITVNGTSCDDLRAADPATSPLEIVLGCPDMTCTALGETCADSSECCNALCIDDVCTRLCSPTGKACLSDGDCCEGLACQTAQGEVGGTCGLQ